MSNQGFLNFLDEMGGEFFLEAEAKPGRMARFIDEYNGKYSPPVDFETDGICTLNDSVDKWGVELRIYLNNVSGMPSDWVDRVYKNSLYHANEFSYRIDDNELVWELFDNGYRIGYN